MRNTVAALHTGISTTRITLKLAILHDALWTLTPIRGNREIDFVEHPPSAPYLPCTMPTAHYSTAERILRNVCKLLFQNLHSGRLRSDGHDRSRDCSNSAAHAPGSASPC